MNKLPNPPIVEPPAEPSAVAPAAEATHAEIRREQILDAATGCFARKGFHAASMVEIARSFGKSPGHIYNYFPNKDSIVAGIVARDLEHFQAVAEQILQSPDIYRAMVDQTEAAVISNTDASYSGLALEVNAEASRNPRVAAMVQEVDTQVREGLCRMLEAGRTGGAMEQGANDAKVTVLMAMFEGLVIRAVRNPDLDRKALVPVLQGMIRQLLAS